ncbi:TIM-barrel domain-containing protein [Bacillus sp. es.036]|uniref:TIM-barrel domain-containing protein n=1 Tax=Bacillus sp. es.036 TaxID=1761764 RepID=UPI000C00A3D6|nr:TIM-barrel domain-containing protein [Bacillus sp. es.036]PFG13546.1 alpha-glucosidase (family GH31 glycosyl hydrolase) [Bacillus sp. es.036]
MIFSLFFTFIFTSTTGYAIDGVYHDPYGIDGLYDVKPTERSPKDPVAGQDVSIKIATWPVEPGQSTWITWTKNGVQQPVINGEFKYNDGNNTYWEVNLGSLNQGDDVEYTVHANKDGANEKTIGSFDFTVTDWENLTSINSFTDNTDRVEFSGSSTNGNFTPEMSLSFAADDVFRVQMSPNSTGTYEGGLSNYTVNESSNEIVVSTSELQVKIQKDPYKMSVYEEDGQTLITEEYNPAQNRTAGWLTDGSSTIDKVENHFYTPTNEEFFGFGERYNQIGKRGTEVDTYVYNQYRNQGERTYLAVPFFLNTNGYGVLVNSTHYSKFKLATEKQDMYSFTTDTGGSSGSMLDYYFIHGTDLPDVIANYTDVTAKPEMLPKWAFGLWMSANEWDRQSEVDNAVAQASNYDIPATAMVLEQWSDEHTFYAFNDAQYTPVSGGQSLGYEDYTFGGKWSDPKGMVDNAHANDIRVLMWQIPVLKYTDYDYEQKDNDESYMINQGYAVENGDGSPYRVPENKWFGNSLLLDFTNQQATDWWMSKRSYLFDDIGIDGFKTDGGEMVWGRDVSFENGKTGDEMRNQYPNEYVEAYSEFAKSKQSDALTFSRAGTTGAQEHGIFWAGDQTSTFSAYREAIRAGLSANASGIPFWSWDLAGFTGSFPTAELYKRSTTMSAFSPIMQFHSEKANPSVSEERSPWNVADRTGDSTVIDTFREYTNMRMNLLPYIYSEAKKSSDQGVPLMKSLGIEYPEDSNTHDISTQYLFGDNLLVSPIVEQGAQSRDLYLPEGEWIDFFYGAQRPGNQTINYYAGVDDLPVFVKSGSILPMNFNDSYVLGGSIDSDLDDYNQLTFRIYPKDITSYDWFDDIGGSVKEVVSDEKYDQGTITIDVPTTNTQTALQVFTSKPQTVTNNSVSMTEYSSLSQFTSSNSGWYYDAEQRLLYVRLNQNAGNQEVVLSGVKKPGYEAEYAELNGVSTNTNHSGYSGTGFVDEFAQSGDSVKFEVEASTSEMYTLDLKYAAGNEDASREIFVNGTKVSDLFLGKTNDWDTWNNEAIDVNLNAGFNTIEVRYGSASYSGINLDSLSIY